MRKLIIAKPSPYARKARVALLEKRLDCEVVVDNPWLSDPAITAVNPLGKVPALILDDGVVVHDSKVIVEYLETLDASPALIPGEASQRIAHKQIEAIADGICDAVVLIALEGMRPEAGQSTQWVARQRNKIVAGIAELERLLDQREWFTESGFGLAEIAAGCALDYVDFRCAQIQWHDSAPALTGLQQRLATRASFAATRPEPQVLPAL